MPTDELSFPELDDALRDLRPDSDAPAGWHGNQRTALLSFIETGAVTSVRAERPSNGAEVFTLDAGAGPRPRHRTAVVLAVAAAVALLAAGLTLVPRWQRPDTGPADGLGGPIAVSPPAGIDRFPILPQQDGVTAFVLPSHSETWPRRTSALVGRVDADGVIEDAIVIEIVDGDQCADLGCTVIEQVEFEGRVATVYEVAGGPGYQLRALTVPGRDGAPTLVVTGADPVSFVAAGGGNPVRVLPDTASGALAFDVAALPDGYSLVLPPTAYVLGSGSAGVAFDGPNGRIAVTVGTNSELFVLGRIGPIEPVDVNGAPGWTYDIGNGSPVIWRVSESTWASVTGAPSQDAAIALARGVDFTEYSAWASRYDVRNGIDELPATPVATGPAPDDAAVEPDFPDRFPIVPDDDPRAGLSSGGYGGVTGRDLADRMHAVVAIDDGARLTNGTVITADPTFDATELAGQTAVPTTVAGIEGSLFTNGDTRTFVAAGTPTLLVQAADPVAFIEAADGIPVVGAEVGPDGAATFALGDLPDGYSVAVEPTVPMDEGAVHAWTRMPVDDGAEILTVEVGPEAYAMRWVVFADFERVDVAGHPGWLVDRGGATVIWQVGERSWAILSGSNRDVTLAAASAFEFVDRATWERRYGAELVPMEAPPGTTVPAEDASRLDCRVIGRSPSNFDQQIEIDCGTSHGVEVGMPLVVGTGVFGVVTESRAATSIVTLVTDPRSSLPVTLRGTDVGGELSGAGADIWPVLTLDDAEDAGAVVSGTVVTTSWGLPVGRVAGPADEPGAFVVEPGPPATDDTATVLLYVPI